MAQRTYMWPIGQGMHHSTARPIRRRCLWACTREEVWQCALCDISQSAARCGNGRGGGGRAQQRQHPPKLPVGQPSDEYIAFQQPWHEQKKKKQQNRTGNFLWIEWKFSLIVFIENVFFFIEIKERRNKNRFAFYPEVYFIFFTFFVLQMAHRRLNQRK